MGFLSPPLTPCLILSACGRADLKWHRYVNRNAPLAQHQRISARPGVMPGVAASDSALADNCVQLPDPVDRTATTVAGPSCPSESAADTPSCGSRGPRNAWQSLGRPWPPSTGPKGTSKVDHHPANSGSPNREQLDLSSWRNCPT